jgi:hypothetical protein
MDGWKHVQTNTHTHIHTHTHTHTYACTLARRHARTHARPVGVWGVGVGVLDVVVGECLLWSEWEAEMEWSLGSGRDRSRRLGNGEWSIDVVVVVRTAFF